MRTASHTGHQLLWVESLIKKAIAYGVLLLKEIMNLFLCKTWGGKKLGHKPVKILSQSYKFWKIKVTLPWPSYNDKVIEGKASKWYQIDYNKWGIWISFLDVCTKSITNV